MRMTLIPKKSRGFTLTEVMTCIAILGVLSAIAIPNYLKHRQKGLIAKATGDLKALQRKIQDLGHDTGLWPGDDSDYPLGKRTAGHRSDSGKEHDDLRGPEFGLDSTDGNYPDWQGPYYTGPWRDPWGQLYFIDYDYHLPDGTEVPIVGSYGPNKCCKNVYDEDNIIVILPSD